MDETTLAAVIGAGSSFLGVVVGVATQYIRYIFIDRKRKRDFYNYSYELAYNVELTLNDISKNTLYEWLLHNINIPDIYFEEIMETCSLAKNYDPQIAINLKWSYQALINIKNYISEAKKIANSGGSKLEYFINCANVDSTAAIKYLDFVIFHSAVNIGLNKRREICSLKNYDRIVENYKKIKT